MVISRALSSTVKPVAVCRSATWLPGLLLSAASSRAGSASVRQSSALVLFQGDGRYPRARFCNRRAAAGCASKTVKTTCLARNN